MCSQVIQFCLIGPFNGSCKLNCPKKYSTTLARVQKFMTLTVYLLHLVNSKAKLKTKSGERNNKIYVTGMNQNPHN